MHVCGNGWVACGLDPGGSNSAALQAHLGACFVAPTMSQAAPRRPPWLVGRTRRSGAQRRAQDMRAEAGMVQRLLKCFAQLQHRGCGSTALGKALAMALQPSVAEAPSEAAAAVVIVAPERPPGTFYAKAQSYAAPATAGVVF